MANQWALVFFTLLIGCGAGMFATIALFAALKKKAGNLLPALITSLCIVIAGGIASVFHVHNIGRIFGGFAHISSGITQEIIALAVLVALIVVFMVLYKRSEDGTVNPVIAWVSIIVALIVPVVAGLSYLMGARPAWDTIWLPILYLAQAILMGGFGAWAFAAANKAGEAVALSVKVALAGAVAQIAALVGYVIHLGNIAFTNVGFHFDSTHPTAPLADYSSVASQVTGGEQALLFWGGVVAIGALVTLVIAIVKAIKGYESNAVIPAIAGLVCALIGGLCFRIIFFALGYSMFGFY